MSSFVTNKKNREPAMTARTGAAWRARFERHYLTLAVAAALVLLVLVALVLWSQQRQGREVRASQFLLEAQTARQWESLLQDYPRTKAAPVARLALAAAHYRDGAWEQAETEYKRFLDLYPKHAMTPGAELGRVQCLEARGAIEEALHGYALFLIAYAGHFLEPQALFGKARCLQLMQRPAEARAVYEDYIVAHPDDEWTTQAKFALRSLERYQRAATSSATSAPPEETVVSIATPSAP